MLIPLPVLPVVPCLEHDQENVLLNVFPSMVIGIVKLPPSAVKAVLVETAKLTLEDVTRDFLSYIKVCSFYLCIKNRLKYLIYYKNQYPVFS